MVSDDCVVAVAVALAGTGQSDHWGGPLRRACGSKHAAAIDQDNALSVVDSPPPPGANVGLLMPVAITLSLRDCLLGGLRVSTHCDHCQMGRGPDLAHLVEAAGKAADVPIIQLFDAGRLVCARCTKPWSALTVERMGDDADKDSVIARYWRPGSRSDPEVAGYWRGYRDALKAG